jgi:hypothetical protein
MTTLTRPSREIDGKGRTVRELLAGRKYSIDYYQREYKGLAFRAHIERLGQDEAPS